MAGERVRLEVTARESCGSRESRRLRQKGLVPGILYGAGEARAFAVGERELRHALGGEHGMNQILDVVVGGQEKAHHAVLKDYQLDPVRSTVIHVDLYEVRLDRPIQSPVAVELVGVAEGVTFGGVLSQTLREVTVEALPMSVPDRFELDISSLAIGDSVRIADLVAPEGVTILDDPETAIASVLAPRRAEEEEVTVEVAEGAEAEALAEGEAAPQAEATEE